MVNLSRDDWVRIVLALGRSADFLNKLADQHPDMADIYKAEVEEVRALAYLVRPETF